MRQACGSSCSSSSSASLPTRSSAPREASEATPWTAAQAAVAAASGAPFFKEWQGPGPKLPAAAGQHVVTGDEVEGVGVLDGVGDVGPRGLLEACLGIGEASAELIEAHLGDGGQ